MKLVASISLIAVALIFLGAAHPSENSNNLVAHEWGTFTSVAGANGAPVSWAPLLGASDLPCFVQRAGTNGVGLHIQKGLISGLIRMETPVLYFYSQKPVTLSVHVDFPKGQITEWYPRASIAGTDSEIQWDNVRVLPGENLTFPTTKGASRYYAARATDASPLQIGDQQEKYIFYRGVGNFLPPVWPRYTDQGRLEIRNTGEAFIPLAIVFENHGDKLGYRVIHGLQSSVTVDPPEMTGNLDHLRARITDDLADLGLYPKEAAAMVETWRDSWFEEGTRVIYLMTTGQVDPLLPLKVTPAPTEIQRVFVGRVEMLSPWTEQTLASAERKGDAAILAKLGRFLNPFLEQMRRKDPSIPRGAVPATPDSCVE